MPTGMDHAWETRKLAIKRQQRDSKKERDDGSSSKDPQGDGPPDSTDTHDYGYKKDDQPTYTSKGKEKEKGKEKGKEKAKDKKQSK